MTKERPRFSATHREALESLERQVEYDIAIRLQSFNTEELKWLVKEDVLIEPSELGYETTVTKIVPYKDGPLFETESLCTCLLSDITLENKIDLLEAIERVM